MKVCLLVGVILLLFTPTASSEKNYYKTLGVSRDASDRDIKKSFHKLSLKYHPDKNPSKSAQAKFQEISAAYDILSDGEKRKKYDLYGADVPVAPPGGGPAGSSWTGFPGGAAGGPGGGNYRQTFQFQSGGMPSGGNLFGDLFGGMGGSPGGKKFEFNMGDMGSMFSGFGGDGGMGSGFGGQRTSDSTVWKALKGVKKLGTKDFTSKVADSEQLWLVVFSSLTGSELQNAKPMLEDVAKDLSGMIMVGAVNCLEEKKLCAKYNARGQAAALLFPYGVKEKTKPVPYSGSLSKGSVVKWAKEHIPDHSIQLDPSKFEAQLASSPHLSRAILFTDKEKTGALWKSLLLSLKDRVVLYNSCSRQQEPILRKFKVTSFPTIIGVDGSGKEETYTGESKLEPLTAWLQKLEKKSKGATRNWGWGSNSETKSEVALEKNGIGFLTKANEGRLCGPNSALCIIALASTPAQSEQASSILHAVSQKTLLLSRSQTSSAGGISYSLLDLSTQKEALKTFSALSTPGKGQLSILAYKPKRQSYKAMVGHVGLEEVELFIMRLIDGELRFDKSNGPLLLK